MRGLPGFEDELRQRLDEASEGSARTTFLSRLEEHHRRFLRRELWTRVTVRSAGLAALVLLALCLAVLSVQRGGADTQPVAEADLPALDYEIPTLPVDAHETSVLTALVVGGDVPE